MCLMEERQVSTAPGRSSFNFVESPRQVRLRARSGNEGVIYVGGWSGFSAFFGDGFSVLA